MSNAKAPLQIQPSRYCPSVSDSFYMAPEDRPEVADEDILSVYLIVNGPLGMSAGKIAAQAFQVSLLLLAEGRENAQLAARLIDWNRQGWRTVVRIAETPAVFERVVAEVEGVTLCDEGLTEVETGAATIFASWPYRRGDAPKVLSHKKVPLL